MKVGLSKIIITPDLSKREKPLQLAGYAPRKLCTGVHDDIYARAVYLEGNEPDLSTHILMIVCDIVSIDATITEIVSKHISRIIPIPQENIMISATHTHSGPDYWGVFRPGTFLRYIQGFISPRPETKELFILIKNLLKVAKDAYKNRRKAKLGAIQTEIPEEDRVMINRNSPFDFDSAKYPITVIKVVNAETTNQGELMGLIINYATHGTSIPRENTLITADYIGYIIKYLEDHFQSPNTEFVYFNGPCGEINHLTMELRDKMKIKGPSKLKKTDVYHQNGTWEDAERIGTTIAKYALKVVDGIICKDYSDLKVIQKSIKFPIKDYDYGSNIQSALRRLLFRIKQYFLPKLVKRHILKKNIFFKVDGIDVNDYILTTFQVIKIGDIIIGTAPGEYFMKLGNEVINYSNSINPSKITFIIELVNDSIGYIYTIGAYLKGGYESSLSITPFAGRILTMKLKQIIKEIK
jgi:hypothetical protein